MKNLVSRLLSSPNKFSQLGPIVFVAVFAAIGVTYLLATHAASPNFNIDLLTQNTTGSGIKGVYVVLTSSPAGACKPDRAISNPKAELSCGGYYARVSSISLSGYHVCGCSAVKVGSGWKTDQPSSVFGIITMQADAPPASPPPSTPPTPAPSPPPPSTGGSGSGSPTSPGSSGGTTTQGSSSSSGSNSHSTAYHSSSSSTPLSTGTVTPTDNPNPSTTDVQPALDGSNQLQDSNSSPNVLFGQTSTVTSSDNLVSVTFQKGTFSTDAYCSIDQGDTKDVPVKSVSTIGPYSIDCTDNNGSPLNNLKKSVAVNVTPPTGSSKYVAYVNNAKWVKVTSSNNGKSLSFKLAKSEQFATAPVKTTNWGIIILNIAGVIVLIVALGGGIYLLRRRQQNQNTDYDYWQG